MSMPLKLRDDFRAVDVRAVARRCKDETQVRRLLAIAAILDGGSHSDAAFVGGVTRQIVRDWVLRFNADGPDGLANRKASRPQTILGDEHRRALEEVVEAGPIPAIHGVVLWRIIDLAQWLWTSSKFRSASRPLGMSCGPWAIANSRPGRAIRPSGLRISSFLKRVPCPSGANPQRPPKGHAHRVVVARRSPDWPTDQANPPLGAARNPTNSTQRPAPGIGMDLWRHLPRRGQRRRAGHAPL